MTAPATEGWADLPRELITQALRQVPTSSWTNLRVVCRQWRDVVDGLLQSLTPTALSPAWVCRLSSIRILSLERLETDVSAVTLGICTSLSTLLLKGRELACQVLPLDTPADTKWVDIGQQAQAAFLPSLLSLTLLGSTQVQQSFQQLPRAQLRKLCLQNCSFAAVQGSDLPDRLECLHLDDCKYLTDEHIEWLVQPHLTQLVMRWNRGLEVEATLAVLGAQGGHLQHLTFMPANDIRPPHPAGTGQSEEWGCFAVMQHLTHLSLSGHRYFGNAGVRRLTQLSRLECLDLSITSVTSNGLTGLSVLQSLRSLQLSCCLLTMPSSLKAVLLSCHHLTHLDLSDTRAFLQDQQLQPLLAHMGSLRSLDLGFLSSAKDEDMSSLSELRRLQHLSVAHTYAAGTQDVALQLVWLASMTALTGLDIQGSEELAVVGLQSIASLGQLQQLNIAGRPIPCLPDEFSTLAQLSSLTHLSLSIQHLGYAPSEALFSINKAYKQEVRQKLAPLGRLPLVVLKIWNGLCTLHPRDRDHWQDQPSITAASVTDRLPAHLLRAVINGRLVHDLDGAAYLPV